MTINPNTQINVSLNGETSVQTTIIGETKIQTTLVGGARGLSAYEVWLTEGHTGTPEDFLNWLRSTSYIFVKSSAATVWDITHNMGKFPSVTVVDSSGNVIGGDVQYMDENSIRLTFRVQFAGKAYLN